MRTIMIAFLMLCLSTSLFAQDQAEQGAEQKTYRLIRFSASWCVPCRQQAKIFDEEGVAAVVKQLNVQNYYYDIDLPGNSEFMAKFRVNGIPATFLVEVLPDGRLLITKRWIYGVMTAEQFKQFVDPNQTGPEPPGPIELPPPRR